VQQRWQHKNCYGAVALLCSSLLLLQAAELLFINNTPDSCLTSGCSAAAAADARAPSLRLACTIRRW
jgi:hypothetical protein